METDWKNLAANYYYNLLSVELHINELVQESLSKAEPYFRNYSVYLEPGQLFNVWIPLVGIFRQELLQQLFYVISLVSVLSSFEKWIYPELRPLWWLRELYASSNSNRPSVALQSHDLSCETSGGLPCAHSMSLMVFLLIIFKHLRGSAHSAAMRLIVHVLIGCCTVFMWLSRLYLATEFLHQCILGTYIAVSFLRSCERHLDYLYSRQRSWSVLLVLLLGCLATAVYFAKLRLGLDPHWSVRQAFKWCPEPTYMRHEDSPIFLLARDLGNLMGVALSLPLENKSDILNPSRRLAGIGAVELLNYVLRLHTPKQHGRFAFLVYEFTRNASHSLILIKLLPKVVRGKIT